MTTNRATANQSSGHDRVVSLREYAALEKVLAEVLDRVERVELARNAAHKRIDELESRLSDDGPQGESTEDTTPLEDIADDEKEDPPGVQVGPSVTRAAAIMSHWDQWSSKAPKGRVITGNLRNLLTTATGESLAWKQVYRACRKLEEWSKGRITFQKTRRHGWILVEQSSSVSGG